MIKKKVLVLFIFLINTHVFAQRFDSGFIVTKAYDTIQVQIQKNGDSFSEKICITKNSSTGEITQYTADEILSYGYTGGKLYLSNQIGLNINRLESHFVRVIVDANTPLYYYSRQYFYRSPSGQIYTLLKNDDFYKKNISAVLITNCFELAKDVNKLKLNDKQVSNFFAKYNRCIGNSFKVFLGEKYPAKLSVGIGFGITTITGETASIFPEFSGTKSSGSGIDFKLRYSSRYRGKTKFASELIYLNSRDFIFDYQGESINSALSFDFRSIRVAVGIQYDIININKFNFELFVGIGGGYSSLRNQKRFVDRLVGNDIFTSVSNDFNINQFEPFVKGDLLASYNSDGNIFYFIEINSSVGFGSLNAENEEMNYTIQNTGMKLGVGWYFN